MATRAYIGVRFYNLEKLTGTKEVFALSSGEHGSMTYSEFDDTMNDLLKACVDKPYHFIEPEDATQYY